MSIGFEFVDQPNGGSLSWDQFMALHTLVTKDGDPNWSVRDPGFGKGELEVSSWGGKHYLIDAVGMVTPASSYPVPAEAQQLTVTGVTGDQISLEFDGLEIQLWRSALESDKGQPVIQIDGKGMFRVNVNEGPIWNADPDRHTHRECQCVKDFESKEEP